MRTGSIKRIAGLAVAFMLAIGMISGGSWAYFSASATSKGNSVTAGTLVLTPTVTGSGPAGKCTPYPPSGGNSGYVTFQKLYPGDTGSIQWTLTNNGSLNGTLTIACTQTFSENGVTQLESYISQNDHNHNGTGDLDVCVGIKLQCNGSYIMGDASHYVAFSGLASVMNSQSQTMAASGGTVVYLLSWSIASDGNGNIVEPGSGTLVNQNVIQSDTATIGLSFTLTQS